MCFIQILVELDFIHLTLTSSTPLDLSCLSSNPLLTGDKHLGCYSPPPLKESRPEIRCERLLREEKLVIQFPTSVIALGYLTSKYQRLIWSRHFLILALRRKLLSEEFPSLASIKHCFIGRNPRQHCPTYFILDVRRVIRAQTKYLQHLLPYWIQHRPYGLCTRS